MTKAFFAVMLALMGLTLWQTLPRMLKRECPVCLGQGKLAVKAPVYVAGKDGQWREKSSMLCPFCVEGRISHYDLDLKRELMMRWMVKEQKLAPTDLLGRVEKAWGQDGLDELHQKRFFMSDK